MKVLITYTVKEPLKNNFVSRFPDIQFDFKSIEEAKVEEYEIISSYGEDLTEETIHQAKQLKWLMIASAGVNELPLSVIKEKGIKVTNVSGIHKTPMAESILAHLLSYYRGLQTIYSQQTNKEWKKIQQTELKGKTALIVGPGRIGQEVARLLQAFGVKTIGLNHSGKQVEYFNQVAKVDNLMKELPGADIIISLLPSTKETHHLYQPEHFQAMKDTAIFMNFGRGDAVASPTIIQALEAGEIAKVVLDVFEKEPLPSDHPLWTIEDVVISPHASSHSSKYLERALEIFSNNLTNYQSGNNKFINLVDLDKGY